MRTVDDLSLEELREWIADLNLWADGLAFAPAAVRHDAWREVRGDGDYELRAELLAAYAAKVAP